MERMKTAKKKPEAPKTDVKWVCEQLQSLQRERAWLMKTVNMFRNRLRAMVACRLGYSPADSEKDREAKFKEADVYIKGVGAMNDEEIDNAYHKLIRKTLEGIGGLEELKGSIEKAMEKHAKSLPVAGWVVHTDQRGLGIPLLAVIIGETGDLSNYANPAKLWKRLGCAPYDSRRLNLCRMGSTWKRGKEGNLKAEEWAEFGYCARRRSISYLIGKGIMMLNYTQETNEETGEKRITWVGPYRRKLDEAKASMAEKHPDDPLYPKMRCNYHGMLMATKLLLKNLWVEWNNHPPEKKRW